MSRRRVREIPGQLDLFKSKKGVVVPNPNLRIVRENKAKQTLERKKRAQEARVLRARKAKERIEQKIKNIQLKITAYNLAWKLINSAKLRPGTGMMEEAWWIVKKLSPPKGKNKIGRRAGFKRVFNPTISNLRGLEVKKLRVDFAERFVEEAKKIFER